MSKKSESKTEVAAVPGEVQRLAVFGPPLLLEGEDAAAYARHQFLSDTLSNQDYDSDANMRMKVKDLSALLRPNPPDMSTEALKFVTSTPQGPHKLATILLQEAKKLLAMDRYERRALSRRKFAIRAFDAANRDRAG